MSVLSLSQGEGGEGSVETGKEGPGLAGTHHDQDHHLLLLLTATFTRRGRSSGRGQVLGGDVIDYLRANVCENL